MQTTAAFTRQPLIDAHLMCAAATSIEEYRAGIAATEAARKAISRRRVSARDPLAELNAEIEALRARRANAARLMMAHYGNCSFASARRLAGEG